jgi:hypothetical protein
MSINAPIDSLQVEINKKRQEIRQDNYSMSN